MSVLQDALRKTDRLPDYFPVDYEDDVAVFDDALDNICGQFRVQTCNPAQRVSGAIAHRDIGGMDMAIVSLDAECVIRDRKMIRRDPGEHMFLIFQYQGHSEITQGAQRSTLAAGEFFLADATVPSMFTYGGQRSRQLSLHIPRTEAIARFGPSCTGGRAIATDPVRTMALQTVLASMLNDASGADAMAEALLNILGAALLSSDRGEVDAGLQLYRRAVGCLARHAFDPGYGLDALTAELGASRRQIQRVFTAHGDTISRRLTTIRLTAARARLNARGPGAGDGIAAIAHDCGFRDLSHFYRVFRNQFGVSPGKFRSDA